MQLNIIKAADIKENHVEYICDDWLPLPKSHVSLICGEHTIGKSWVVLQAIIRFLKRYDDAKAFYWSAHDNVISIKHRFSRFFESHLFNPFLQQGIEDRFYVSDTNPFGLFEDWGVIESLDAYDLIVFDPLESFTHQDEFNDKKNALIFMNYMKKWAYKHQKVVIMVYTSHDEDEEFNKRSGVKVFLDNAGVAYKVEHIKSLDGKILDFKSNEREVSIISDKHGAKNLFEHSHKKIIAFPPYPINESKKVVSEYRKNSDAYDKPKM